MKPYDHKKIEKKWQSAWQKKKLYAASDTSKKPKFYGLIEFPYPSGDGLHVGHVRSNTAMDAIARKRRMQGFNVLYPIGWDAFGLPTENYAIKTGIHPKIVTKKNTDTFRRQLKSLGFSFDWAREIDTTDPAYYRWTQWIFLQFYKHGLAYKKKMAINWCPKDKIGLANEEVVDGCCERCGTPVEKREKEQWMLAITKYADRLAADLDATDFLEKIKLQQHNWIGKSEGAEISFEVVAGQETGGAEGSDESETVKVFTTRPDTLFGVTYIVLVPEHPLVHNMRSEISNWNEVEKYIAAVRAKNDIDRTAEGKEKTGVELRGVYAIHPATRERVPVWIADYVLASYGTGAVMAVPAHDDRDFDFAKKYKLPMKQVIAPFSVDKDNLPQEGKIWSPRRNVMAVVKHPTEDKIIQLQWKEVPWKTLVIGGAEGDEPYEEAIIREVQEETGYMNFKKVEKLGWQMETHFYAAHKDVNRQAFPQVFYIELENLEKKELSDEEAKKHTVVWVPRTDLQKTFWPVSELGQIAAHLERGPHAFTGSGKIINSGEFNGMDSETAKKAIVESIGAEMITTFKLRDWVFSRQRYWGEPIPMIFCEKCDWVPVPEKDLPVKLPDVKNYEPTDSGESPLASITKWVNTKCPACGGKARRETDTMPNWAGSSWYFLRYIDPKNKKAFADPKKMNYWTPVDWYNGGMEHTTLHLLYSRFWNKFLFDIGLVPTSEPYKKRTSHGLILADGGVKMSKSKGNVINPDSIVETMGADTLRVYEMFIGPFDQAVAWSTDSIVGSRRFLEKVWRVAENVVSAKKTTKSTAPEVHNKNLTALLHKTIDKISTGIENMEFNTAISSLMILLNEFEKQEVVSRADYEVFLKLLAPFAPHITEELWTQLGNKNSIHITPWPEANPALMETDTVTIVVQVAGKVRASFETSKTSSEEQNKATALALPEIVKWIEGKEIRKVIYVPGKLINIVL